MSDVRDLEMKVFQSLMDEHKSDTLAALLDLCARYVKLYNGVSPGFLRWGMNDAKKDIKWDVPPNPITDDWIATGVDP